MKIYHIPVSSHADDLNAWMGVNSLLQNICEYSLAARAVVLCFFTFLNLILDWSLKSSNSVQLNFIYIVTNHNISSLKAFYLVR